MVSQVDINVVRSSCNSAVDLPSAAVRTITPKFFVLIASTIFCKRRRSSPEWIFLETAIIRSEERRVGKECRL